MASPQDENLKAYEQLCTSYRAIDDFRSKLLGFLPLVSGSGVFLLLNDALTDSKKANFYGHFLLPIGLFGFVVTLGLFSFELYGILKCHALIGAGKKMENALRIDNGQFTRRPRSILYLINEPFASGVIYSAVLAAWIFLASLSGQHGGNLEAAQSAALRVATWTFVISFCLALIYNIVLVRMGASEERKWKNRRANAAAAQHGAPGDAR